MDHKRIPTPPPPPARPSQDVGTSAKSAPPAPSWIEHLSDDRRIGQAPLPRERVRGDPCGTSRSAVPRLATNATASIPFNDKSPDHKWEIVPAFEAWTNKSPSSLEIHIANCAVEVARPSGLADSKGTLCFLEFMDLFEKELK